MNQRIKHTETSPSRYAAAYGYDYRYDGFGGSAWASQSAAWSRTLTEHRSSSWITDANGDVNQHLQYLPFGESFIDQRTNHDIRYKFTTKEEDSETGYQYFGARYYASDLSVWLSVDPLSDEYPSTSPFMYVLGNPIALIDPNGMNTIKMDESYKEGVSQVVSNQTSNSGNQVTQEDIISSFTGVFVKVATDMYNSGEIKELDDISKFANMILEGEEGSKLDGFLAIVSLVTGQYDFEESANDWASEETGQLNETIVLFESVNPKVPIRSQDPEDMNTASLPVQAIRVRMPSLMIKNQNTGRMEPVSHIVFAVSLTLIPFI